MYLNLALISGFILFYTAVGVRLERSPLSGAMVFTAFGLVCDRSIWIAGACCRMAK